MSTRHSRVANREALSFSSQAIPCGQPMRRSTGIGVADSLGSLIGTPTEGNVDNDGAANCSLTQIPIESNDPRRFRLKAANKIGSGNIADAEQASDSDGDRNSSDMDSPEPIDSHSSFATRH